MAIHNTNNIFSDIVLLLRQENRTKLYILNVKNTNIEQNAI